VTIFRFATHALIAAGLAGGFAGVASAQKSKDMLRIAMKAPIQTMSYYLDPQSESVFTTETIFDNLIIFDEAEKTFKPLLAKSWKQLDDTTLEIQLRDDIKWHDGEKFDADDVVYTLRWITDPKTQLRFKGNWEWIGKVEKTGPYTVRVTAKQPTPYALTRLAYLTSIEAEHAHGKAEDKVVYGATKPVGTGMYKVVEIDRNKHVLLERNKDYRHGGTAKAPSNIGRMELIPIPDSGARVAQFLINGIDLLSDPGLATAEDLAKKPGVEIAMGQGTAFMYMAIDAKGRSGVKPLTDVRVRRALMMAINRDDVLAYITHGRDIQGPKAMCWDFQAGCAYTKPLYPYDPAGAKKLLAEAGYPVGFDLEVTTFIRETVHGMAQVVANQFNQIGVRTTVQGYQTNTYRKKQADGKIQVMIASWPGGGNPDVQGTLEFVYAVPPSRDYSGDAEMNALAEKSLTIIDPDARKAMGQRIFDRSTEMAYFTPVGPSPVLFVHNAELSVHAGAFSAYGINPQGLRWK
jgi:peptide/nickel transport system substrate-binding protein